MRAPVVVYLALGSNQGDRRAAFGGALRALAAHGVRPCRLSPLYDTDYVGAFAPQDPYLNAVVEAHTQLGPVELLETLHAIECAAGRAPDSHQLPRSLDIDIVLYGDQDLNLPGLVVPHPRAADRRFVLQPLADLGALAGRREWQLRLQALEPVQALRAAGTLGVEEWRAQPVA